MIRLARSADADLEDIYAYGFETFGPRIAEDYARGLWDLFSLLEFQPGIGRALESGTDTRVTLYRKHFVYYRRVGPDVVILRVLSPRQPQPGQL